MALRPFITLFVVTAFQVFSRYLEILTKKEPASEEQIKLKQEINQLLKEASSLSTPSTFAQAAMLKRKAAAKEKELNKIQEEKEKAKKSFHDQYTESLRIAKVLVYSMLIWAFWSTPIASVPQHILQPFGKLVTWKGPDASTGYYAVGIIPWLVLTSRVSKFLCKMLPEDLFV
ncbi:Tail-anchored protein insertion receptor WRB [Carex littledalei]|uniref:Tail-anchored protein insertion receptor WRB n=1 Tax=Carex littledalei TaxID=544730 RepID=A0A833QKA2_9POAL|nr:Tail-anchored protein insertion receptor WRB [Carex littledalei]